MRDALPWSGCPLLGLRLGRSRDRSCSAPSASPVRRFGPVFRCRRRRRPRPVLVLTFVVAMPFLAARRPARSLPPGVLPSPLRPGLPLVPRRDSVWPSPWCRRPAAASTSRRAPPRVSPSRARARSDLPPVVRRDRLFPLLIAVATPLAGCCLGVPFPAASVSPASAGIVALRCAARPLAAPPGVSSLCFRAVPLRRLLAPCRGPPCGARPSLPVGPLRVRCGRPDCALRASRPRRPACVPSTWCLSVRTPALPLRRASPCPPPRRSSCRPARRPGSPFRALRPFRSTRRLARRRRRSCAFRSGHGHPATGPEAPDPSAAAAWSHAVQLHGRPASPEQHVDAPQLRPHCELPACRGERRASSPGRAPVVPALAATERCLSAAASASGAADRATAQGPGRRQPRPSSVVASRPPPVVLLHRSLSPLETPAGGLRFRSIRTPPPPTLARLPHALDPAFRPATCAPAPASRTRPRARTPRPPPRPSR